MNTPITSETQLSNLLGYAEELGQYKADYKGKPNEFTFGNDGLLTNPRPNGDLFGYAMAPVQLTDHALTQACAKLGQAYKLPSLPVNYMRALQAQAPETFAGDMNAAIERLPKNGGWLVRTYESTCRAILSDDYLLGFDNKDMLGLLNTVLESDGSAHRISTRSFVNVNNMVVDILFKDVETGRGDGNGSFQRGVRIRNGEIGDWKGGVFPIVKRTSCDNSISVEGHDMSFTFKHFGKNTAPAKRIMLRGAIANILPFSVNIIEKLLEAEEQELPKFSDIVNGLAEKHGWHEEVIGGVFAGSETHYTLAGLVNGITFAAHANASTQEQMTDMEFLGGELLFDKSGSLIREAVAIHQTREAREARRNR